MSKSYAAGMFLTFFGVMIIASASGCSDVTAAIAGASFTAGISLMLSRR